MQRVPWRLYDPDNVKWKSVDDEVAEALVSVNSVYLGFWLDALRPVRAKLAAPLATISGIRIALRPNANRRPTF